MFIKTKITKISYVYDGSYSYILKIHMKCYKQNETKRMKKVFQWRGGKYKALESIHDWVCII